MSSNKKKTCRLDVSCCHDVSSDGVAGLDFKRKAEVFGSMDREMIFAANVNELAVATQLVRRLAAKEAPADSQI